MTLKSIELFTGAGGLALGIHQAGFEHLALVEYDSHSCRTLETNRHLFGLSPSVSTEPTDVGEVNWSSYPTDLDLLAGGVPCQPFSLGGQHRGQEDHRNLFPEMIRAVRELAPKAVLIENVKGLLRPSFRPYFNYVLRQLERPEIAPRPSEQWSAHDGRLMTEPTRSGLSYTVRHHLIQSADYGVPQTRQRVLIVAYRSDLVLTWIPPEPTHSMARLIEQQWVTGRYWKHHGLNRPRAVPAEFRPLANGVEMLMPPGDHRWQTVRDALQDLQSPERRLDHQHSQGDAYCPACNWGNPGARSYPGHDGSIMDWPAKTLKAGVHGVPGGENMLRNRNGTTRYFTVREAARLQKFPDDYHFPGSWGESFRQLGNAVPVSLANLIAQQLASAIRSAHRKVPEPKLAVTG